MNTCTKIETWVSKRLFHSTLVVTLNLRPKILETRILQMQLANHSAHKVAFLTKRASRAGRCNKYDGMELLQADSWAPTLLCLLFQDARMKMPF